MKATGIVRRVDELGRVVLPIEMRRSLHISTGDPVEFYVENDGIIIKKYDTVDNMERFLENVEKRIMEDELPLKVYSKLIKKVGEMRKILAESSE